MNLSVLNREKLTLSPCPINVRTIAQPSITPFSHHKFRKIQRFLYHKVLTSASEESPSSEKYPHWITSPPSPDFGRLLRRAPYMVFINYRTRRKWTDKATLIRSTNMAQKSLKYTIFTIFRQHSVVRWR